MAAEADHGIATGGILRRVDRGLAAALRWISVGCLSALFLTISFVVVTRIFGLRSAGWTDELIELLQTQVDAAKDRRDVETLVRLSQRLSLLLERRGRIG